ncbi:unnamed protein product, partial [Didymodactylos carnosus]
MDKPENLYKILGIDPNSSVANIRKAYKEKALLFHPDKNSSPNAENMFKTIKKAYDILSNESARTEYANSHDFEGDDDIDNIDGIQQLHMGKKYSDEYRERINNWIEEYRNVIIVDNFTDELTSVTNDIITQFNFLLTDGQLMQYVDCEICNCRYLNKDDHQQQMILPYDNLFKDSTLLTNVILDEQFKKIASKQNVWDWKQALYSSTYASLLSDTEWQKMPSIIEKIKRPIEILSDKLNDECTIYIDNNCVEYKKMYILANTLVEATKNYIN